jgi:hypothetical protein
MIIALLSALGLIFALVVMIMSSVVASRIETIDVQGQVCILLNSIKTGIAYDNAIVAAVFTGVIISIFISSIIIDLMHEDKQENNLNIMYQSQTNQSQQQ